MTTRWQKCIQVSRKLNQLLVSVIRVCDAAYRAFLAITREEEIREDARRVYAAWLAIIDGDASARSLNQHALDEAEGLLQADIE